MLNIRAVSIRDRPECNQICQTVIEWGKDAQEKTKIHPSWAVYVSNVKFFIDSMDRSSAKEKIFVAQKQESTVGIARFTKGPKEINLGCIVTDCKKADPSIAEALIHSVFQECIDHGLQGVVATPDHSRIYYYLKQGFSQRGSIGRNERCCLVITADEIRKLFSKES